MYAAAPGRSRQGWRPVCRAIDHGYATIPAESNPFRGDFSFVCCEAAPPYLPNAGETTLKTALPFTDGPIPRAKAIRQEWGAAGGGVRSQRHGRTRAKEGGRPFGAGDRGRAIGGAKAHTPEAWRGRLARTPVRSEEASGAVARSGCSCPRSSREVLRPNETLTKSVFALVRAAGAKSGNVRTRQGAMLSAQSCSGGRSESLRAAFCRVRRTWRCGQRRDSPQAAAG